MFLDQVKVHVIAGSGGAGAMHFRREKYVPLGGPDGGDGGMGGSVILRAERGLNTLFAFKRRRKFTAESGEPGGGVRMHGKSGQDLIVDVPIGTIVRGESGEILADLTRPGEQIIVARGGHGGLGNVHFKSSTNQAPGFAEKGEPGHERWLELELRLIADVGIIGTPNAGKSTLISVMSAARPKIADYPFTTLVPNLGVVELDDYAFVAADIPGLIEGAHEGIGLGHEFLRHVERTLVLIHLVDGSAEDPMRDFRQVQEELQQYNPGLLEKPQIVVINKMDLPEARDRWPELRDAFLRLECDNLMAISAVTRDGVPALIYRVADLLRELAHARDASTPIEELAVISIAPPPDHFTIERKRNTYFVHGEVVERLAVMTDTQSDQALYRLQRRLKRMGVFTALERAGVQEGSKVRFGEVELIWDSTYQPEVKPGAGKTTSRRGI